MLHQVPWVFGTTFSFNYLDCVLCKTTDQHRSGSFLTPDTRNSRVPVLCLLYVCVYVQLSLVTAKTGSLCDRK